MNAYERVALSEYLSEYPADKSYDDVIQMLEDDSDEVLIWEPFEDYGRDEVCDFIESHKRILEANFTPKEGK